MRRVTLLAKLPVHMDMQVLTERARVLKLVLEVSPCGRA